ncbi:MAG: SpoIID/LytB domain-containing protein [Christensenellaceae bacterium]|nr:SpoIID/LytB domain-containing protein [Christensenellaceae bacterium]
MKRKNLTTGLVAILLLFSLFLLRNFEPIRMRKQDFGDIRLQKIEETTTEISYLIRFFDGEKLIKMPLEEYIFCVVAAEMPASYESAALEAQATLLGHTRSINPCMAAAINLKAPISAVFRGIARLLRIWRD